MILSSVYVTRLTTLKWYAQKNCKLFTFIIRVRQETLEPGNAGDITPGKCFIVVFCRLQEGLQCCHMEFSGAVSDQCMLQQICGVQMIYRDTQKKRASE